LESEHSCYVGLKGIRKEMERREGGAPMRTPYAALFWLRITDRLDEEVRLKVVWATVDPIKRGMRF